MFIVCSLNVFDVCCFGGGRKAIKRKSSIYKEKTDCKKKKIIKEKKNSGRNTQSQMEDCFKHSKHQVKDCLKYSIYQQNFNRP